MSNSGHAKTTVVSKSEQNRRIYDFLQSQPTGVLSTVDETGSPHGAVIYYSINENFEVLFATRRETKKSDNLTHNNRAVLVIYDAPTQTTAQVTGDVAEVTEPEVAQKAFENMVKASLETSDEIEPPIEKLNEAGDLIAYKLTPAHIHMAVYGRPDHGGYDLFDTVDLGA